MQRRDLLVAAIVACLATVWPQGPAVPVGELPPSTFVLESIDGERFDLAASRGQQPLVLLFFRGTW